MGVCGVMHGGPRTEGWTDEEVEKAFAGFVEASDRAGEVVAEATARGFGGEVDTRHRVPFGCTVCMNCMGCMGLSPRIGVT